MLGCCYDIGWEGLIGGEVVDWEWLGLVGVFMRGWRVVDVYSSSIYINDKYNIFGVYFLFVKLFIEEYGCMDIRYVFLVFYFDFVVSILFYGKILCILYI